MTLPARERPAPPFGGLHGPSDRAEDTPTLGFAVRGADVLPHAAAPTLRFELRLDAGDVHVQSVSLNVQVNIVASGRGYDDGEETRLFELFGAPRDWGRSLRPLVWSRTSLVVPSFDGSTAVDLCVPCSYDFDVAANKYLHAVRGRDIPLEFLFSGSVFYRGPEGNLRTVRLPWDRECSFAMPASLWHELMERYFPNSAWLRVRTDVFERLHAYRSDHGLPTWEATLDALLPAAEAAPGRKVP